MPVNTFFTVSASPVNCLLSADDQCLSSIKTVNQHLHRDAPSLGTISNININSDVDLEPFDNTEGQVTSISLLSEVQKSQLVSLLREYHAIFRKRPGLTTLYTCRFDVSEDVPFKIRPYSIPFARCPAVDQELNRMIE